MKIGKYFTFISGVKVETVLQMIDEKLKIVFKYSYRQEIIHFRCFGFFFRYTLINKRENHNELYISISKSVSEKIVVDLTSQH